MLPLLAKAVGCGSGLHVDKVHKKGMDSKVKGIKGSWEDGCDKCGRHLEAQGKLCPGWYCEKNWNWGIWLKRDHNKPCGQTCGNGMHVNHVNKMSMDQQVHGISGSWENGCNACGRELEKKGKICSGWYCEKNLNYGIWLKRDSAKPCGDPLHYHCGNGKFVLKVNKLGMDEKVHGIKQGEWENECKVCGAELEAQGRVCPGWYCEKNLNYGVWLKRDSRVGCGADVQFPPGTYFSGLPAWDWTLDPQDYHDLPPPVHSLRYFLYQEDDRYDHDAHGNWGATEIWKAPVSAFVSTKFNPDWPTKYVVSGFQSDATNGDGWTENFVKKYLEAYNGELNLIIVNPEPLFGFGYMPTYTGPATNTQDMGYQLALIHQKLEQRHGRLDDTHCIGHSLGAQSCARFGRTIAAFRGGVKIARITALDPASPMFKTFEMWPFSLKKTDAEYVEVVHSNARTINAATWFDYFVQGYLGHPDQLGHVDYYLNGGQKQPQCKSFINGATATCHHMRAVWVWLDAVQNVFTGYKCMNHPACSCDVGRECNQQNHNRYKPADEWDTAMGEFSGTEQRGLIFIYASGDGNAKHYCTETQGMVGLPPPLPSGTYTNSFLWPVCAEDWCYGVDYDRGFGHPAWGWDDCEKEHGKGNCEWGGALIYPKCRVGFWPLGPSCNINHEVCERDRPQSYPMPDLLGPRGLPPSHKGVPRVCTIQQKVNMRYLDAHESGHWSAVTRTEQGNDSQKWVITPVGRGYSTIQQKVNMRYLDAHEDDNDWSAITQTEEGSDSQKWKITNVNGDYFTIQQKVNMRYLDAHESGHDWSAVTRTAQGNDSQRWKLTCIRGDPVTVTIGNSGGKTKTVSTTPGGLVCPASVDKSNWLGGYTYPDRFEVSTSGNKVTVKRLDANHGWGMNLRFTCHTSG